MPANADNLKEATKSDFSFIIFIAAVLFGHYVAWKPTTPSPDAAAAVSFQLSNSEEELAQLWRNTADMLNKASGLGEARWRFLMGGYGEVECFVLKPQLQGMKRPLAMLSASRNCSLVLTIKIAFVLWC